MNLKKSSLGLDVKVQTQVRSSDMVERQVIIFKSPELTEFFDKNPEVHPTRLQATLEIIRAIEDEDVRKFALAGVEAKIRETIEYLERRIKALEETDAESEIPEIKNAIVLLYSVESLVTALQNNEGIEIAQDSLKRSIDRFIQ